MFDGHWRTNFERGLRPIGIGLRRTGLQADHLTGLGIAMAVATAVAIGAGYFRGALLLLLLTGLCDFLDGALAKASGITNSRRGAFFDSVTDRLTGTAVSLAGGVLTCVFHLWRFDLETGACLAGGSESAGQRPRDLRPTPGGAGRSTFLAGRRNDGGRGPAPHFARTCPFMAVIQRPAEDVGGHRPRRQPP